MSRMIEISDKTFELIKDQLPEEETADISCFEDLVNGKYFFRTVTYHLVGKVTKVFGNFLRLKDASWVADSGRFMNTIKAGELSEVEPVGTAFINMQAVTDFFPWKHSLPKDQK